MSRRSRLRAKLSNELLREGSLAGPYRVSGYPVPGDELNRILAGQFQGALQTETGDNPPTGSTEEELEEEPEEEPEEETEGRERWLKGITASPHRTVIPIPCHSPGLQKPQAYAHAPGLRKLREEAGLTQMELAQKSGYYLEDVQAIEKGKAYPSMVISRLGAILRATHQEMGSRTGGSYTDGH